MYVYIYRERERESVCGREPISSFLSNQTLLFSIERKYGNKLFVNGYEHDKIVKEISGNDPR